MKRDVQAMQEHVAEFKKHPIQEQVPAISMALAAIAFPLVRESGDTTLLSSLVASLPLNLLNNAAVFAVGCVLCGIPIFAVKKLLERTATDNAAFVGSTITGIAVNVLVWGQYAQS